MTDTDGGRSPWERDDWMPVESAPVPFHTRQPTGVARPTSDGASHAADASARDARDAGASSPRSRAGRSSIVGVVVTVAIVGAIGLLLSQRETGSTDGLAAESGATIAAVPSSSETPTSVPPNESSDDSADAVPTTQPFVLLRPVPGGAVEVVAARPDGSLPDLAPVEVGQAPAWVEWSLPVPAGLDAMEQPTEVVVLSTGMLHRIEFPSGRVRSVGLTERWDPSAQLAIAGDTVAVTRFNDVLVLGTDRPAISVELGQGVDLLRSRPAQGDFLVTGRRTRPEGHDQQWLLAADGTLTDITGSMAVDISAWEQAVLPDGSIVANRPGGVYSIGFDGTAHRLDDGSLVAVGANHFAVTRCDTELRCAAFMVDSRTGDEVPAVLGPTASSYFDPSLAISPDGRFVLSIDWQQPQPMLRLVDTASGEESDLSGAWQNTPVYAWAADGSGIFTTKGETLLFNGVDGETVGISGLGTIKAIAAQPLAVGG